MSEEHGPPPEDPGPPPANWVYSDQCFCVWCVWHRYLRDGSAEQFENQETEL